MDQPIELAKYKGLKLVRSIDLESWKLCSKQLFQFCCCWQPPKKNDNNNFLGGMCHVGLLDQSVVLYHVWWTRCGFISCYPSSHWPFRAQLLVRQRRLHLEGHTGPMEIRVPKQVTAFIACMFWRFWSPICFRTAVVEACSLTPASISTRTHTLEGFMNQLECTLCIQCSIKCIVSSKYQLSWIRVWFLAAWRPRTAARAYLYTHGLFRLSRWRRILARTGPPDYPVPPCVDHFPRETMGCPHLCMLVYLRINKSWFS